MDLLRDCHNNQGTAANEANDPKGALRHFEIWKDMSLQRRAQDGQAVEDYELGCVYHELGVAYAFNDDYTTAIDNFLRCWHIWEKLEEFKENMLLWPVSNLGFLYNELGRLEEAEDMLLKYLKIQADEFGVDDVETFR
jgi:tetratricopeptide (TPR) repeat protein